MPVSDTCAAPPAHRIAPPRRRTTGAATGATVAHAAPPDGTRPRAQVWRVGPVVLCSSRGTGFHPPCADLYVPRGGRSLLALALRTPAADGNEATGPRRGPGESRAILLERRRLGVSAVTIRTAEPRLRSSPLYPVVLAHAEELWKDPAALEADPAAAALGHATGELVRALIVSAAHDGTLRARTAGEDALLIRVLAHVRDRLGDTDLDAASIARAHSVSKRRLYEVFHSAGLSLEQRIIEERLEGARTALARPGAREVPIARVARMWGFTSHSHFTRRFREAYGITPKEWRLLSAPGPSEPTPRDWCPGSAGRASP